MRCIAVQAREDCLLTKAESRTFKIPRFKNGYESGKKNENTSEEKRATKDEQRQRMISNFKVVIIKISLCLSLL